MFRSSLIVWGREFQTRGAGQRVQNSAVQMQFVVVECSVGCARLLDLLRKAITSVGCCGAPRQTYALTLLIARSKIRGQTFIRDGCTNSRHGCPCRHAFICTRHATRAARSWQRGSNCRFLYRKQELRRKCFTLSTTRPNITAPFAKFAPSLAIFKRRLKTHLFGQSFGWQLTLLPVLEALLTAG